MCGQSGIDIDELIWRGTADAKDVQAAILRCTSCTRPDACAKLVSWRSEEARYAGQKTVAQDPPEYCVNRDAIIQHRDQ